MQAQKWLPAMPGVRGRFSSSLCHKLAVGNPRVFVKNGFRESPDTAVHILLDSSGSMTDSGLMFANAVCYALGIMCSSTAPLLPHTSRVIETLPQLAPALFELLEGALRRKA